MTKKDMQLIEQAYATNRWDWRKINDLIEQAETREAAVRLRDIKWDLIDSVLETL